MAQTKQQIQAILASIGGGPRKRFGQNFMIDQNLVRLVAQAGQITPTDTVIEVGPGTGSLTEELLARAGKVIAVEIDRDLAGMLRERFRADEKFELIQGDALDGKHDLNPQLLSRIRESASMKLVANLPYNIASPLVIDLLIAEVGLLAFTVQKEVADRLKANAGDDAYGPLSVMAQLLGQVDMLRTIPPQAFWPPPKIDSALVRIIRGSERVNVNMRSLSLFVHAIFSFRRKTLRKALLEAGEDASGILDQTGFDGTLRPEAFTPRQLLQLFHVSRRAAGPTAPSTALPSGSGAGPD